MPHPSPLSPALTDALLSSADALMERFRLNDVDPDRLYQTFKASYEAETGASWGRDKLMSRARSWTFYGDERGFVACRVQRSGMKKLVAVAGEPRSIMKGLAELQAEGGPIWGAVSAPLAQAAKKRGMIVPHTIMGGPFFIKALIRTIPPEVFGGHTPVVTQDGGIQFAYDDVGTVTKYLIGNKAYFVDAMKIPQVADQIAKVPGLSRVIRFMGLTEAVAASAPLYHFTHEWALQEIIQGDVLGRAGGDVSLTRDPRVPFKGRRDVVLVLEQAALRQRYRIRPTYGDSAGFTDLVTPRDESEERVGRPIAPLSRYLREIIVPARFMEEIEQARPHLEQGDPTARSIFRNAAAFLAYTDAHAIPYRTRAVDGSVAKPSALSEAYRETIGSQFTHDGQRYDLNMTLAAAETVPLRSYAVADLAWILDEDQPDPARVAQADLSAPVLITMWQNRPAVIDGLHRLARAKAEGLAYLPGKMLTPLQVGLTI